MATDKRARKKEHRDVALAQRQALLRRRRLARLGAVATVLVLIVAAAVITGTGDDDEANEAGGNNPPVETEQPTPPPEESSEPEPAGAVACGAEAPKKSNPQQYPEAEQVLEDGVDYRAVIETSCGTLEVDLLEENAPVTVNNFVFLSKEGFYDGLTFHRIEPQFVIQGGDPEGTGGGGPGYQFEDELWAKSKAYDYGTMAMANAGPNTNGSQFFVIVHKPTDQPAALAPAYSVFGEIPEKSWPTLEKIRKVDTAGSTPISTVYIESIEIVEGGAR